MSALIWNQVCNYCSAATSWIQIATKVQPKHLSVAPCDSDKCHTECTFSRLDLKVSLKVTMQGRARSNVMWGACPHIVIQKVGSLLVSPWLFEGCCRTTRDVLIQCNGHLKVKWERSESFSGGEYMMEKGKIETEQRKSWETVLHSAKNKIPPTHPRLSL